MRRAKTPAKPGRVGGPELGIPTPSWVKPRVHAPYEPPAEQPPPPPPYVPEEG